MPPFLKQKHLRLDPDPYRELHRQVLERDQWHCQYCGSMAQLEVHHLTSRSRMGDDADENLITLCRPCHRNAHQRGRCGMN